jgi:hypothetical protein
MNCSEFEALLYASIEEHIEPADGARMTAHEASCASCRRLAALVSGSGTDSSEFAEGLAESVLMRTSGKPCEEVAILLAEDGSDTSHQEALWPLHVETCKDCRALQGALARMRHEIPALAELETEASLVDSVLSATLGRRPSLANRRSHEGFWIRFVRRPRAALEGAYVTAMLLLVVTGLPWSLSGSSGRTLDSWWRGPAEAASGLVEGAEMRLRVGQAGLMNAVDESMQSTWRHVRAPDLDKLGARWNQTRSGSVEQDSGDQTRSGNRKE